MSDRDDLPEILLRRRLKHARAEATSARRRKSRNAPRRDDVARVGLFHILVQYGATRHEAARTAVRNAVLDLLTDAGFSGEEAATAFDEMAKRAAHDLDRYLVQRGADAKVRKRWRKKATPSAAETK